MLFTLLFTVLALAAATCVCIPLLRGVPSTPERQWFDRAVYRDQLREVEQDLLRSVLTPEEAQSARLDIQRRLLTTDARPGGTNMWSGRNPVAAITIALFTLGVSTAIYWHLGAPSLPDAPYAARFARQTRTGQGGQHFDIQAAATRLEQNLKADPSSARGWLLYARAESMLGDWQKASDAYHHAIDLGEKSPDVLAGYGETLVLGSDGIVSPAAHAAFEQVLAGDAKNRVARYYLARADAQAGEEQKAINEWLSLAADIPDDSPMREAIERGVAEAAKAAGVETPALPKGVASEPNRSQPRMNASREAMIRNMVAQLAARLQSQPDDLDGWLQLGRSYAVLGETEKSVDAYAEAARLRPNDVSIKLQALDVMVAGLPANAALPPRAAALLHQAAAIAPNQPEVLWYLGVDAIHAGRMEDARQDWTKLLSELPGDGQEAKLVKQALDALPRK